jgi:hypothetical protein
MKTEGDDDNHDIMTLGSSTKANMITNSKKIPKSKLVTLSQLSGF